MSDLVPAAPFKVLIQDLHKRGASYAYLALISGVHPNTIRRIAKSPRHSLHAHTARELERLIGLIPDSEEYRLTMQQRRDYQTGRWLGPETL